MKLWRSEDFNEWCKTQTNKIESQIEARLAKIKLYGYLGNHKYLAGYLWELKFNNGNRIYYTIKEVEGRTIFLILGGNKNGQQKDISKAQRLAKEIHEEN